ncbi:hypothetical protein GCM10014715_85280 [Streptomyces spiralis]|uniref:Uncharacterized protein n=1 Tax=Streptomyces spiralis TaxID=66376 RepID=A0A919AN22_9ACTN|nr:hypothetical protein GCM10014715_85280 [Streptomyces spiralis]
MRVPHDDLVEHPGHLGEDAVRRGPGAYGEVSVTQGIHGRNERSQFGLTYPLADSRRGGRACGMGTDFNGSTPFPELGLTGSEVRLGSRIHGEPFPGKEK